MDANPISLTDLERVVLERIGKESKDLDLDISNLSVESRKLTGCGSYTYFRCESSGPQSTAGLRGHIKVPGLGVGLGAVLFLKGRDPYFLELYTFGDEPWEGESGEFEVVE